MTEFKVLITYTEYYSVYVEAEDEYAARGKAIERWSNGDTDDMHERMSVEVELA